MSHFIKLTNEDGGISYVNMDRVAYFVGERSDGLTTVEFMTGVDDAPLLVKETAGEIRRLLQLPTISG